MQKNYQNPIQQKLTPSPSPAPAPAPAPLVPLSANDLQKPNSVANVVPEVPKL
jgi:hypothetical protein